MFVPFLSKLTLTVPDYTIKSYASIYKHNINRIRLSTLIQTTFLRMIYLSNRGLIMLS